VLQLRDVQDVLGTSVDDQGTPVCTPESVHDYSCDASPLGDEAFLPRPTGGTVLLEGSVEVRFPVDGSLWEGAAFLDFGEVWAERDQVTPGDLEWTPGLGIRYFSPIGPIRVDLAYSFAGGERLQVVTADVEPYDPLVHGGDGELRGPEGQGLGYAESDNLVPLDPTVLWGDLNPWSFRRFQLHFSIGQAF
jgi:outer membrane protein assembly factor BamA